jgi:hypothetical protein
MPGQLLQVEPVVSFGSRLTQPRYYFFVPVGRFNVGDAELCKTDSRYAEPPESATRYSGLSTSQPT